MALTVICGIPRVAMLNRNERKLQRKPIRTVGSPSN
jgi:hypothetical protein